MAHDRLGRNISQPSEAGVEALGGVLGEHGRGAGLDAP